MCLSKRFHELTGETIVCDDNTDTCTICGGYFKHSRRYVLVENCNGLKQVLFKTAHSGCIKIMGRIKQKRQEITDLEWEIYMKSERT